ncbi:MAG: hypothetical protein QF890_07190 [Myxococcota bacterium]|jgi:hypothetical protein|nr:hypothetical protein [bacterium]MDP6073674.1 hypothetical protein [Myxococcota bacterium]MDP6242066.1 hypothetical protein [Myxococcota bacterium]MDP7074152.1 hypothetical protein [Myxococcota bacterium]MDP7299841.1 hypothetical protein [Myxococcota bacterium]
MTQIRHWSNRALLLVAVVLVGIALFRHLSYPLMWADEAETAMFAERVLAHGYPKVHGPRNVIYQFGPNAVLGVKEGPDAYIGTTWGQFYFAVPGLLWARGSDDLYTRTLRARLPFALAGGVGIGLWLWALLPFARGSPGSGWRFSAAFLLLVALSVSLLLHLREVRYYALLVALGGAIFFVHLRYAVLHAISFPRWAVALVALLFLLFHTFFQAAFSFAVLLGAERGWAAWRGRTGWRDLAPFAAAAALAAPFVAWFELLETAAAFSEGFDFGFRDYLHNLGVVGEHLLRHEFLVAALAARAAAVLLNAGGREGRAVAAGLLLFSTGYVALGCLNPLPLERYFVVLSPAITGAFLLDAFALAGLLPQRRAAATAACAAVGVVLLGGLVLRGDSLAGRLAELRTPYRGPLDFAIPAIAARYPRPEELVIATNYEEYAFMHYLGSHVIVGLSLNNLANERGLEPDIVVPRRRWPRSLAALRPFLARGQWETQRLPVRDVHHNNIPALSASRFVPDPHRFTTPESSAPDDQLVVYWRGSSANRTGTSSSP